MRMEDLQELMSVNGENHIKNDDLPENKELKDFITEWTVNSGDTIVLPIYEKQEYDEERALPISGAAVSPDIKVLPTCNPLGAIMYLFSPSA